MWLHTGIELFFISAGTLAIVSVLSSINKALQLMIAYMEVPPPAPSEYEMPRFDGAYVTCGGCGRVVRTKADGFTIEIHDCDAQVAINDILLKNNS